MSQQTNPWKLGLFVLIGVGAVLVTFAWLGARHLQRDSIQFHAFFDQDVSGLDVGAPVRFRGILIGRVAEIRAAPDRRRVEVVANVFLDELRDLGFLEKENGGTRKTTLTIPDDLRVQLVSSLLTGVCTLETDFVDVARYPKPDYPFPVPPNTIYTIPSTFNQVERGLVEALGRLPKLLESATQALERLEQALDDMHLRELSAHAEDLLTSLQKEIDTLADHPFFQEGQATMQDARKTFDEVRALAADLRAEDGDLATLLKRYDDLGQRLEAALDQADLPGTTASLRAAGGEGAALGRDARSDLRSLRDALDAARRLFELLERDPASVLRGR